MIKSASIPSFHILKQQVHVPSKYPLIKASSASSNSSAPNHRFISTLKTTTAAVVFAAAVFGFGKFHHLAARFIPPAPTLEQSFSDAIGLLETAFEYLKKSNSDSEEATGAAVQSNFQQKLNPEDIGALKTLLQRRLKAGKNKECLGILRKLSTAQPEITDWKYLAARLLNEMGNTQEAIEVLLPILRIGDLPSPVTIFEISLLVDLTVFEELKSLPKHVRESSSDRFNRLIEAQLHFLLNDVDKALMIYEELERDEPRDFCPYYFKEMIYNVLDRKKEAREQFAKYRGLCPEKIEVEWYLRTPVRRIRLFLTPPDEKAFK